MKSVKKRGGNYQPLDIDKIHAVLEWACNGGGDSSLSKIRGVSVSEIEMRAKLHLHDKISTKQIHECLIRAAADLISEETPNYDQVAARLVWFAVRKEAFDSNIPPHLYGIIKSNIKAGFYTKELLQWYSEDEWDVINAMIDHRRDDLFKYAGAEQMRKKYLCQNRKTKKVYETFQIPYILVSATLFASYPKETRLQYVKDFYDLVSQHYISLPTPIMAGVRTKVKQFSSCTVIKCGDDLDSIKSSAAAIVDYASRKAGIGLDVSALRAVSQGVRNGDALTTGLIPFIKFMNGALKSVSQGGLRGASATVYYPGWHLEFENLIELKNNKGTDETRVRTLDYGVALNEFMYTRFVTGGVITLFSPEEVPDLYAAFYSPDKAKFAELYEKYERDDSKTKKCIPAVEYFTKLMTERFETGRIYIFHADTVNTHTPFVDPIYSSNLCAEIALANSDLYGCLSSKHGDHTVLDDGLIALCTLGAINVGKLPTTITDADRELIAKAGEMLVRGLDALLDYQDYAHSAAYRHTMLYRPLGIGVIGYAHWLAKGGLRWGAQNSVEQTEDLFELISYNLIRSSINLAKEKGRIQGKTKFDDGVMPIDTATVKPINLKLDWQVLRDAARQHGIRNATLMALMPSENSSILSNETNGIEPPRSLVTVKGSKEGQFSQVAPEFSRLNHLYQTLWEVESIDYLTNVASMQKFVCQSISTNTTYDPSKGQIKMSKLIGDLLFAYKKGLKTLYYCQVNDVDGSMDDTDDDGCGGACKV